MKKAVIRRRRVGGFTPANLVNGSTAMAWYDPSDLSTLFQDDAETVPVTASGQAVAVMRDKSGNGLHARQTVAGLRPIYTESGKLHYLAFSGSKYLVTGTITPGAGKAQVFCAVQKLSDAASAIVFEFGNATTSNGTLAVLAPPFANNGYSFWSKGTALSSLAYSTTPLSPSVTVVSGIGAIASDTAILRVDGVQVASAATDQGTGEYGANAISIGCRLPSAFNFSGNLYGLIVRFSANDLSAAYIAATEAWMANVVTDARLSDDVIVQNDGAGYFYARTSWNATHDKVQRFRFGTAPDLTANNLWDHHGERLIPIATATTGTKAAFDASTLITRSAIDEGPPFNLNGMWLGGGHGPLCRQLTITGHGFVTGDLGSKWTDGVRNRILAQIVDANTVRFIAENTGTTTNWSISSAAVSGSTLTWVSGGVATGTKTVAADTLGQAYPFIRNRVGSVSMDNRGITAPGTYGGETLRFSEQYDIPNLARSLDYIVANTTSGTNSLIHASIGAQVEFSMDHTLGWTGIVQTDWSATDIETYTNGQYGGAQTLRPETPAGGTLFAYVPKSKAFSGWDFASGQNITAWASSASFTPASSYVDPADPPDIMAFVAKNSGGVAQWGHFYAIDNTVGQGLPAYRDNLSTGLLFTAAKKAYIIAGGIGGPTPVAGTVHETVNYVGTFQPSTNPSLTWAVTYPKSGKYALSMRAPGALTSQWVAVDPRLVGRPVTLIASGGVATLETGVVQAQGVLMTFSATGTAEVAIG